MRKAPSRVEVLKIDELTNYITQETRRISAQEIELMSKEILNVHAIGGLKFSPKPRPKPRLADKNGYACSISLVLTCGENGEV